MLSQNSANNKSNLLWFLDGPFHQEVTLLYYSTMKDLFVQRADVIGTVGIGVRGQPHGKPDPRRDRRSFFLRYCAGATLQMLQMLQMLQVLQLHGIALLFAVAGILGADGNCVSATEVSRITDIRFWQSPEEAQIVLDLSAPPVVSPVHTLKDGTFYFDIEQCGFRPGHQRYPLNTPFIEAVTVQEKTRTGVRVFFRTMPGVGQKTFVLPSSSTKPPRIVVFLSEPATALLARREEEYREVRRLKAGNVKIIVLDPGHGGEDPGTNHRGIMEKEYVLTMGYLIKAYFDRNPRYRAILTRSGDYIIPLDRRREIAEHLDADAFVSLHINYNKKPGIQGIEVYCESPKGAIGQAERLVAELENQQDVVGGVAAPPSPVVTKQEIVRKQAAVMFKSRQLADKVEAKLAQSGTGLSSRGVKRAGFKVLHSLSMPSILVEFGYISNPFDARLLSNSQVRAYLARAVYLGVCDFLEGHIQEGLDASYFEYIQKREEEARARAIAAAKAKAAQAARAAARNKKTTNAKTKSAAKQTTASKKTVKPKAAKKYTVRPGDTMTKIASQHKLSLGELLRANSMQASSVLKAGSIIVIP